MKTAILGMVIGAGIVVIITLYFLFKSWRI